MRWQQRDPQELGPRRSANNKRNGVWVVVDGYEESRETP